MEALINFLEGYLAFLLQWSNNLTYIGIATCIWGAIVVHLFATGHAKLGLQGKSNDCACGDTREDREFVIFGGPAGLSFGLPYYLVVYVLTPVIGRFAIGELLLQYWGGFVYLQFFTSVVQFIVFIFTALFSEKPKSGFRFFKAHLQGCGWVSALSPVGWIFYLIQQLIPEESSGVFIFVRDIETRIIFWSNMPQVLFACVLGSLTGTVCVPVIKDVDHEHTSKEGPSWSGPLQ